MTTKQGNDNQTRADTINQIKLEIAKSVIQSRYFRVKTCTYDPPHKAIPARIKKLLVDLNNLENPTTPQRQSKEKQ